MIEIIGELQDRINANVKRLEHEDYTYKKVFELGGDWEGDWQGRTILALASHVNIAYDKDTKDKIFSQLKKIILEMPNHLNEHGYLGKTFNGKVVSEQQVSGTSWLLRGLCEYYKITKDAKILEQLQSIADNYLLKLKPYYKNYPLVERESGGVGGHLLQVEVDGWYLSSDVGCAYMMLDGITALYDLIRDDGIKDLIEIMIENFTNYNYLEKNFQTHAMLSATRGVYRFFSITQDKKYLDIVIKNFDYYLVYGMTANFANYNWYGRELWTEPCGVVDSLIVAKNLYLSTNQGKYLQFVSRIYQNAITSCQRLNGGAGCETCLDDINMELKVHLYEANFCCTMRFAEGLKELVDFAVIENQESLCIPQIYTGFKYNNGEKFINLNVEKAEKIFINIQSNFNKKIVLYVGSNVKAVGYTIKNNCIELASDTRMVELQPLLTKERAYIYGDTLMTKKQFEETPKFTMVINNEIYSPITNFLQQEKVTPQDKIIQTI